MRLTKAGGECGQSNSPSFKENHKQTAAPSKMLLCKLKNFLLLLAKHKWDKSPLIPVPYIQAGEKPLDVL